MSETVHDAWCQRLPRAQAQAAASEDVINEGFAVLSAEQLPWRPLLPALRAGVVLLLRHGWHPSFIFMFDEAWQLLRSAAGMMQAGMVAAQPHLLLASCSACAVNR